MSWDCEIPEFYAEAFPRARKPHACCECHAPIDVAEKHMRCSIKSDGYISSYRQHMLCRQLCMAIRDHSDAEECVPFGSLHEFWSDGEWGAGWNKKDAGSPELRKLYAGVLRREKAHRHRVRIAEHA